MLNYERRYVILNHPEGTKTPLKSYLKGKHNKLTGTMHKCNYVFDLENSTLEINGDIEPTILVVEKKLLYALGKSQNDNIGFIAKLEKRTDNTKTPKKGLLLKTSRIRTSICTDKITLENLASNAIILPNPSEQLFLSSKEFQRNGNIRVAFFLRYSALENLSRYIVGIIIGNSIRNHNGIYYNIDDYLVAQIPLYII